ncbi:MAG: thiamine phosphate synthase [Planctomycetota bacterium]
MQAAALRMLDANLNRCREGLRTMEDVARFALDDAELSELAKTARHRLALATSDLQASAITHRDTPGDVGTRISTPAEADRPDLAAVALAAGKRTTEALRVVEETLKTLDASAAAEVEQVRYAAYELERRLTLALRPRDRFAGVRVYVLITESFCRRDWFETSKLAIDGGADVLQLREPDLPSGELLIRARRLRTLCGERKCLLIVNDRPDVALLADADGVHVGQSDLPCREVRKLVGASKIVGVSTHDIDQVEAAWRDGADYVGVGPVFPSPTKPRDFLPGLEFAHEAAALDRLPTVAIGGITSDNAPAVWQSGVTAIAVTSAVTKADDPASAVRQLAMPTDH